LSDPLAEVRGVPARVPRHAAALPDLPPRRPRVVCGAQFRGLYRKCSACRWPEHPCVTCGRIFRASNGQCQACRKSDRKCVTCGKTHRRFTLECDSCSGRQRQNDNARRARKLAAEVTGPVPRSVYIEVVASGPCVYCGAAATHVDHVRPLALGGHEARYNLAPACQPCNQSKGGKLLIHWDPVRVAYGIARSATVADELELELAPFGN
jgi:5-methylcytosine-specific restriction endonuclease McrA